MPAKDFKRELASFIALALSIISVDPASAEEVALPVYDENGQPATAPVYDTVTIGALSARELSSLELLATKFEDVRRFIPSSRPLGSAETDSAQPLSNTLLLGDTSDSVAPDQVPKGLDPRIVAVSKEQFETAVEVYRLSDAASRAYREGRADEARQSYDELASLMENKRQTLFGGFETIGQLDEAIGTYSIAQNGDPQALDGGVIVFVVIEVYVST